MYKEGNHFALSAIYHYRNSQCRKQRITHLHWL